MTAACIDSVLYIVATLLKCPRQLSDCFFFPSTFRDVVSISDFLSLSSSEIHLRRRRESNNNHNICFRCIDICWNMRTFMTGDLITLYILRVSTNRVHRGNMIILRGDVIQVYWISRKYQNFWTSRDRWNFNMEQSTISLGTDRVKRCRELEWGVAFPRTSRSFRTCAAWRVTVKSFWCYLYLTTYESIRYTWRFLISNILWRRSHRNDSDLNKLDPHLWWRENLRFCSHIHCS